MRSSVSSGCICNAAAYTKMPRTDELLVLVMLAQNVANVLAQETFDALAKFLHAIHVRLLHAPCSIRRIGRRGLNFLIVFLTRKFHETSVTRSRIGGKCVHRLDDHGHVEVQFAEARHAHQLRHAVDLSRT